MDYRKHIASPQWRKGAARLGELEAADSKCRICSAEAAPGSPLEVHHRTYENLGNESVGDLTTLCRDCHREVTNFLRARRYSSVVPKRADVIELRDARGLRGGRNEESI
jgi:5-methylcytosine-specific restriction endonuclease McrA